MWLLDSDVLQALRARALSHFPSAQEQAQYARSFQANAIQIDDGVAVVSIAGVLTDRPSLFAQLFGDENTVYADIVRAVGQAERDPRVTSIVLDIDSPGGQASAEWVAALDAIAQAEKPVLARVGGMATSAAYALATQADRIVARNRMSMVGSVGVAARIFRGLSEVTVTSTQAPNKAPNPRTPEGVNAIREELDAIHGVFVEAVAQGRNTTPETVNSEFGRGGAVLAETALARGMIDAIAQKDEDKKPMTLDELQTQHPDIYQAAVARGVTCERDRVTAHLIMGKTSGAMDVAVQAVENGEGMTATLNAKYMSAALNQRDIEARAQDNAPAIVPGPDDTGGPDLGDQVADLVEAQLGIQGAA